MNKKWLVWSIEHTGWWLPNHHGYTGRVDLAGRYSYEEALEIVTGANYGINHGKGNSPFEAMCLAPEEVQ